MSNDALWRWRLVLGKAAEAEMPGLGQMGVRQDRALEWLYEKDEEERTGGDGASALSVPDWLNEIHELFYTLIICAL